MLHHGLGVPDVGVLGHLVDGHARMPAHHLTNRLQRGVKGVDHGVDLDAVTGGDDHRLTDLRAVEKIFDQLRAIDVGDGEPLEYRHRRAAVRDAEQEDTHTPTDLCFDCVRPPGADVRCTT
jgi:hypothetical protein